MAVKVAINGFGRIGRLAFRQMFGAEGYEVVAVTVVRSVRTFTQYQLMMRLILSLLTARLLQFIRKQTLLSSLGVRSV